MGNFTFWEQIEDSYSPPCRCWCPQHFKINSQLDLNIRSESAWIVKCAVQWIFTIEHTHRRNALIRRQNTASTLEIYLMLPSNHHSPDYPHPEKVKLSWFLIQFIWLIWELNINAVIHYHSFMPSFLYSILCLWNLSTLLHVDTKHSFHSCVAWIYQNLFIHLTGFT